MERFKPMIKRIGLAICIFSLLALAGCSKVNKDNYDKIQIGGDYGKVVEILGEPNTCEEAMLKMRSCTWGSSEKQIEIKFIDDTVIWRSSKGL